jgi:50S ribosomal protein L16 3-hydroxylase
MHLMQRDVMIESMKRPSKPHGHKAQHTALLGGMSRKKFLEEYWQKKPLLIRGAIPGFMGLLSADELAGLACEDDVQSRLVSQTRGHWRLENGPFAERRFAKLPQKNWTLLVQGVNHHLQAAVDLLQQFDFIPHARLDDLMVSYAPDGGGVGPHFDSYDVFLLQGQGKRLWRIGAQTDLALIEDAPLRLLKNFTSEAEWLLEPGDMLYLPPQTAHWGTAVGDCMTYSIGFRAPAIQELATQFLGYLQENIHLDGIYADPDLKLQKHPAKISADMVENVAALFKKIKWRKDDVAGFLGSYLSEPKAHLVFDAPAKLGRDAFCRKMKARGIALSLKSLALFDDKQFFINGEQFDMPAECAGILKLLADKRQVAAENFNDENPAGADLIDLLYLWHQNGYLRIA